MFKFFLYLRTCDDHRKSIKARSKPEVIPAEQALFKIRPMLKNYITLLLLTFAGFGLNAQCPLGDVTLSSQAEVDSFVADYPDCTEIAGELVIGGGLSSTTDITNISGLSGLTSIAGKLRIRFNAVLTSLTGLEQLTFVGVDLSIRVNPVLTSLEGLEQLTSIGRNFFLEENASLTSLAGLSQLTSIGGSLSVDGNAGLTSLTGLGQLTSFDGGLSIHSNPGITSLAGLENITSIGKSVFIYDNAGLTSLTGLENMTSIGQSLDIRTNNDLTSLTGLGQLTSIGGYLLVSDNPSLTSLTGLEQLTSIGGDFWIEDNVSLMSLTELEQLTSIGENLHIDGNDALTSLLGLENIDVTTINNLLIESNPQLFTCAVASICDYLGVETNTADISGNAMGCATREEVEMACMVPATDISPTHIELFPNPTNGMLQLRNITAKEVVVYTAQGQRIARYDNPGQELDLRALPTGVYHLHLITADAAYAARVVKQ